MTLLLLGRAPASPFNVRQFGALGDGSTNDREAIQKAVDACSKAGGGTVRLPAGDYLCGSIRLHSHVVLEIGAGAILRASTRPEDYENRGHGHLLVADGAEHVRVVGAGTIHGQGTADYGRRRGVKEEKPAFRTGIPLFQGCRRMLLDSRSSDQEP